MYSIAIDGPAGAGKSTIAKKVAKELGFIYVDTGAMYRTMALLCLEEGVDLKDEAMVSQVCRGADINIFYEDDVMNIELDGRNVTSDIRQEKVGNTASTIAVYQSVRDVLVELQRNMAKKSDVVMDGRDIGTAVLPDAPLKIYLTASVLVRAKRRYKELIEKGESADLDVICKDIEDRDYRDMNREHSPLRQAEDAVLVDSSDMSIDEVVSEIISHVER